MSAFKIHQTTTHWFIYKKTERWYSKQMCSCEFKEDAEEILKALRFKEKPDLLLTTDEKHVS